MYKYVITYLFVSINVLVITLGIKIKYMMSSNLFIIITGYKVYLKSLLNIRFMVILSKLIIIVFILCFNKHLYSHKYKNDLIHMYGSPKKHNNRYAIPVYVRAYIHVIVCHWCRYLYLFHKIHYCHFPLIWFHICLDQSMFWWSV